jgi:RND family efflux transporter MFP subunit
MLPVVLASASAGCSLAPPAEMTFAPPGVTVSVPITRTVTDYNDFAGRTAAVETVHVRARVSGYLEKINFREGAEVRTNDVLYEIDPRTYQADFDRAQANLAQAQSHSVRMQSDFERGRRMLAQRAIGQEEYDKLIGDRAESDAAVRVAEAGVAAARLNLEFTKVRAPISGRISRTLVTVGNLVQSGEIGGASGTTLTTIVSVDPVYVYFDVDDLTFMQVQRLTRPEKIASPSEERPCVFLGLGSEQGYPRQGIIDFTDNQVDPGTGTLKMRGLFRNDDRLLTPGLFARVRVPVGKSHRAVLVTDRAVDTDQGQKVLYVVNDENVVEKRLIQPGRVYDGLREIEAGVKEGERVVVDGIQRVRGGVKVDPKLVDMPVAPNSRPIPAAADSTKDGAGQRAKS